MSSRQECFASGVAARSAGTQAACGSGACSFSPDLFGPGTFGLGEFDGVRVGYAATFRFRLTRSCTGSHPSRSSGALDSWRTRGGPSKLACVCHRTEAFEAFAVPGVGPRLSSGHQVDKRHARSRRRRCIATRWLRRQGHRGPGHGAGHDATGAGRRRWAG